MSPSTALAASGEANAAGIKMTGAQMAPGWVRDRLTVTSRLWSEAQNHRAALEEPCSVGRKCQAKQTVLKVKKLKGCWYHKPQSLHLLLLFPNHDREQPASGGHGDNRTLLMQCCVWRRSFCPAPRGSASLSFPFPAPEKVAQQSNNKKRILVIKTMGQDPE